MSGFRSAVTTAVVVGALFPPLASCTPRPVVVSRPPPAAAAAPLYELLEYADGKRDGELRLARPLHAADPRHVRVSKILARPFLRWVLGLGVEARKVGRAHCQGTPAACALQFEHPALLVLVKRGNRPKHGIAIMRGGKVQRLPQAWYVEVDSKGSVSLIAHEYGHVMMFNCLSNQFIQAPPLHPRILPHTTSAITNDLVAFTEGWGIHFETLSGDRRENPKVFDLAGRRNFPVEGDPLQGDSLLAARDLLSYAQSYRRQTCIKENCFSYLPRPRADLDRLPAVTPVQILERWTDSTHDPASLRTVEQMVASEGLVAALFYRLATAPSPGGAPGMAGDPPLPDPSRYRAYFQAFARLTPEGIRSTPAVFAFARLLMEGVQDGPRRRLARILLETTHYSPVIRDSPRIHAGLHHAGRRMEVKRFRKLASTAGARMAKAVQRLTRDPGLLARAAGPELWLVNKQVTLRLPVLGVHGLPLTFDLNTAPAVMLMTIPGVDGTRARAMIRLRQQKSFSSVEEMIKRTALTDLAAAAVQTMRRDFEASMKGRK